MDSGDSTGGGFLVVINEWTVLRFSESMAGTLTTINVGIETNLSQGSGEAGLGSRDLLA